MEVLKRGYGEGDGDVKVVDEVDEVRTRKRGYLE